MLVNKQSLLIPYSNQTQRLIISVFLLEHTITAGDCDAGLNLFLFIYPGAVSPALCFVIFPPVKPSSLK